VTLCGPCAPGVAAVALREVTDETRPEVLALSVAAVQERFVGTVAGALRDAEEIPEAKPWFRAICEANGAAELLTSCVQAHDGPELFYPRIGSTPTGELDENGELILALSLDRD
jgi:hypothetical protein